MSSRSDIFNHDAVDEEAVKEEKEKMDMIMRRLMGGSEDEQEATGIIYFICSCGSLIMLYF